MALRAIRCGTLFDGTGAAPVRSAVIVVDGVRITAVGPAASTPVPAGADVLELSDRFVMPGLVDAHSHISIVPGDGDQIGQLRQEAVPQALRATANLRRPPAPRPSG
jgi:imidazolonepropionase-like amidohydrolase